MHELFSDAKDFLVYSGWDGDLHRSNENKMSDGHRERASTVVKRYKSLET
jgi:hypothetical protein